MSNDQYWYNDLITELDTFTQHLTEWAEQFADQPEQSMPMAKALQYACGCKSFLQDAKQAGALKEKADAEALIKRIETGTTTSSDAAIVRRLMS